MIFVPFSWAPDTPEGILTVCEYNYDKIFCVMTPGGEPTFAILYGNNDNIRDYDDLLDFERHYLWTEGGLVDLPDNLNLEEGYVVKDVYGYNDFASAVREYF